MATFIQHIPGFVETREAPPQYEFHSTDELISIPVVKRHSERKGFSHFAMSGKHLMLIADDGFFWWVLGSVSDPSIVDLPQWIGGKYKAELKDGSKVILDKEVASSCGNELTLQDGTKARNLR